MIMTRRILTAREQLEMLSPWREAAVDPFSHRKAAVTELALTFQHKIGDKTGNHWLFAHDADGNRLGHLSWTPDGEIDDVLVYSRYRRQGIASALLQHARNHYDPDIRHSTALTADGSAWSQKVGARRDPTRIMGININERNQPYVHLVAPDSPEHITSPRNKTGTKYGYPMLDPVALERPQLVLSKGIVARGAEETDFAPYDGPWPLHTAMQVTQPEGLRVTWHPGEDGQRLAEEVRDQNGPRILHDTLRFADGDESDQYLYVARDGQGIIHGVVAGYDDGVDMDIHDAYTSLKAPPGTGGAMIQTVARDALEGGRRLNVKHVMDHSRNYWQQMGAHIPEGEIDGTWPAESHQALAVGTTIPAPSTKVYDDDRNLIDPLDSTRTQIDRKDRLPGSIIR